MRNICDNMVIVDGHVHIYDCFDLEELFDAAHNNFNRAFQNCHSSGSFTGVLMLVETNDYHWFQHVRAAAVNDQDNGSTIGSWVIFALPEDCSLLARRVTGESLLIVAGRQIITSEKLELLALGTDSVFNDGKPLTEILEHIRAHDAIPVIPWAVGKWLGKRGKIISDMLENYSGDELFLGDNGGRPIFWHKPAHFQRASKACVSILPGSDPLPFMSESSRIGSFGFMINDSISSDHPAADLKKILRDKSTNIIRYGHLERTSRFIFNQVRLRVA